MRSCLGAAPNAVQPLPRARGGFAAMLHECSGRNREIILADGLHRPLMSYVRCQYGLATSEFALRVEGVICG
jgi:hypothetical protein